MEAGTGWGGCRVFQTTEHSCPSTVNIAAAAPTQGREAHALGQTERCWDGGSEVCFGVGSEDEGNLMHLRRAGWGWGQDTPPGWAGTPSSSWPEDLLLLLLLPLPKLEEVGVRAVKSFRCPSETEEACVPLPLPQLLPAQQAPAGLSLVPSLSACRVQEPS